MSRFNTGNPLGSGDSRDLDDNAKNMDLAVNSEEAQWLDRFGRPRLPLMEQERRFVADQVRREDEFQDSQDDRDDAFDASQASRETRFNNFIASSGYQFVGDYAPGIEITEYNQLVRDSNGEFWRVSGQVDLPYVTTGAGIPEDDALVPAGDAVIRQDLASPDKGAAMVAKGAIAVDGVDQLMALPSNQRRTDARYLVRGSEFYWNGEDFVLLGPLNVESFNPGENATDAIQRALEFGSSVVIATDRQYLSDSVEVPSDVEFHCNLKLATPLTNLVRVNTGSRVYGHLEGTGSGNAVERLVYPARNGVNDVHLDVTVSKSSVGVQASPVPANSFTEADIPTGWTGTIRAVDISGDGAERGYGFLGSPCYDCNLTVISRNIPRHALYLSNGASRNNVVVHVDGVGHGAVQLAALDGQGVVRDNKVTVFCRGVYVAENDNAFGANLVGNVRDNVVDVFMSESPDATGLALLRSISNNSVCRNNTIRVHQSGAVAGPALVLSEGAVENEVFISGSGGTSSSGTRTLISAANYGAAPSPSGVYRYALRIGGVSYDAGGQPLRLINANANYAGTHIGNGVVSFENTTEPAPVRDNTSGAGFIEGYLFDEDFLHETGVISAGASSSVTVPFPRNFTCPPNRRQFSYQLMQVGVLAEFAPSAIINTVGTSAAVVSIKNNTAAPATIQIRARQRGW